MRTILLLCLAAAAINLPFGYYRAGVPKLSLRWFLAVHLPVPLIIVMRISSGQGWSLVPLMFACDVLGQIMGGMLRTDSGEKQAEKITVEEDER
ncbi:MAG: hypothetical protein ACYCXU_03240 [Thermoleophilia bacterium]